MKIGIIGAGQLALMMGLAAKRLGFAVIIFSHDKGPASFLADEHFIVAKDLPFGHYEQALEQFAELCDIVTYESENIPIKWLKILQPKVKVAPDAKALGFFQDRYLEKRFLRYNAISTVPWLKACAQNLEQQVKSFGKAILKTRSLGYDGKGQIRLDWQAADFAEQLAKAQDLLRSPCILEKYVNFSKEISVIAARNHRGECAFYSIAENIHDKGILRQSFVPAAISREISFKAFDISAKILHLLNYCGVLAIEFFIADKGKEDQLKEGAQADNGQPSLYVNEIAPRVHNSGHWTEAACHISQFEQHIRAIADLPLGVTERHSDCLMENILGEDMVSLDNYRQDGACFLHLYGKKQAQAQRKMGHGLYLFAKGSFNKHDNLLADNSESDFLPLWLKERSFCKI